MRAVPFQLIQLVRRGPIWLLIMGVLAAMPAIGAAQEAPLFGDWLTPSGSVVRIGPCTNGICLWIVKLGPSAAAVTDVDNPKAALRSRPLCGLKIGRGFHLDGAKRAAGGTLYDPNTGHTYHGEMTLKDGSLRLRGYVGIPLFGRTETWRRDAGAVDACNRAAIPKGSPGHG